MSFLSRLSPYEAIRNLPPIESRSPFAFLTNWNLGETQVKRRREKGIRVIAAAKTDTHFWLATFPDDKFKFE